MTYWVLERGAYLDLLQLGVAEGRTNITMAEHALDDFDPLALHNQMRSRRVSPLGRPRCMPRRSAASHLREHSPVVARADGGRGFGNARSGMRRVRSK